MYQLRPSGRFTGSIQILVVIAAQFPSKLIAVAETALGAIGSARRLARNFHVSTDCTRDQAIRNVSAGAAAHGLPIHPRQIGEPDCRSTPGRKRD